MSLNNIGNSLILPLLNRNQAGRHWCNASNVYTRSSSQIQATVNCEYPRFCICFINKIDETTLNLL